MLRYAALGSVEILGESGPLSLGGGQQRRLLALLIAHPGRFVSVDAITEALWGDAPPGSAKHAVQTVASRLRHALGPRRDDVTTGSEGYRLAATTENCDLVQFETLIAQADDAATESALELHDEALALWRGDAFGSLSDLEGVRLEAIRLDELRLTATEHRFQLLLDLARYTPAIPELEAFVAAEPLRERSRGQLMQALYWSGRQPDALSCYQEYRELLGEELGLEPSPPLRALEESIVSDSLMQVSPVPGARAALTGSRGQEIERGPDAAVLEQTGWDRLWALDHERSIDARQRAYVQLLRSGDRPGAARLAIWLGVNAAIRLKMAVAFGWFGRAQRLLEGVPPGPSHGLLLALIGMVEVLSGSLEDARDHAETAQEIGSAAADPEVEALAQTVRGWALVRLGEIKPGLSLIDEAMASAVSGELGEYITALIYCRTLCACLDLMDYQRATEWNDEIARARESGAPSDLPGDCRTHRLAVLLMQGDWEAGEREAVIACAETDAFDQTHLALAQALRGEMMLHRGRLDEAEELLRSAQEMGATPYPGLALLRRARGDLEGAAELIGNAVAEAEHDPLVRAALLPAFVEIALARGDQAAAASAATDLEAIAARYGTSALDAYARQASAAVQLAQGDSGGAIRVLRAALRRWVEVGSDYRAARCRMQLAEALAAAGRTTDSVAAASTARDEFARLGARPDEEAATRMAAASS